MPAINTTENRVPGDFDARARNPPRFLGHMGDIDSIMESHNRWVAQFASREEGLEAMAAMIEEVKPPEVPAGRNEQQPDYRLPEPTVKFGNLYFYAMDSDPRYPQLIDMAVNAHEKLSTIYKETIGRDLVLGPQEPEPVTEISEVLLAIQAALREVMEAKSSEKMSPD